jgi:hypothetical protein
MYEKFQNHEDFPKFSTEKPSQIISPSAKWGHLMTDAESLMHQQCKAKFHFALGLLNIILISFMSRRILYIEM